MGKIQKQRFPKPIRTMTDEKLLEPDFFRNKRPLPAVGIFDEPKRCYEINHEWAKIVMGWVSWLATVSAWEDAQDDDYVGITEILKFLVGINCNMPYQLRQNTTNSCLLEQSLDGGETWTTVFDFSQCVSIVDSSGDVYSQTFVNNFYNNSFQTFQNNIYNYYENNYINNVTDVAPELGYGDGDDSFRDEGLCWAIGEMIDEVCEAAIAYFDDLDASADDLKQSLALAAALIGIIGLAATGVGTPAALALAGQASLWGAGIGIGALIGTDLFNHFTSTNRSAYEDLAAREEVQCCLFEEMKGSNVNRDSFFNDLTLCTGLSTNGQAIADAVQKIFSTNAGYAAFTEKNRIGFNSAKAGLLAACPCISSGWCNEFDFTASQDGFGILPDNPQGQYLSGQGFGCTQATIGPTPDNRSYISRAFGVQFTPDEFRMRYIATARGGGGNHDIRGFLNNNLVFFHDFGAYVADATNRESVYTATHTIDEIWMIAPTGTGATPDSDAYIHTGLQISGAQGNAPTANNCP